MKSFWWNSVGGAFSRRRSANTVRRQSRRRDVQRPEQLEERRVMAFDFVSAFPNVGQFIRPNDVLNEAPQQITLRFSPGAKVDRATLGEISIVRAGGDNTFNNGNDFDLRLTGAVGFVDRDDSPNQNQVVLRFAENLPDDLYRITIGGGLKTEGGPGAPAESFRNGGSYSLDFRLDLGAQVVSVVPQPISRGIGGALQHARDTIEVFFNKDPLDEASAESPRNYRLVETDPATGADLAVQIPTGVAYDRFSGKATLTFAADLGDKIYRLQVGGSDDDNGTIAKAVGVGTIFQQVNPVTPAYVTNSFLGDGDDGADDVDFYELSLPAVTPGATLTVRVTPGSGFTPALRLFRHDGTAITAGVNVSAPSYHELTYTAPTTGGKFFLGLSSTGNVAYNADGTGAAGGTTRGGYRLEIFSSAGVPGSDDNSSFRTATGLGTLGLAGQSFNAAIDVRPTIPTPVAPLQFPSAPGTIDEPGHREIPLPTETHEMPAASLNDATGAAVRRYFFPRVYGSDSQGNPLINAITETQKQRAREIFELYSRATGVRFVETASGGLTDLGVVTGDLRAVDPSLPVPNGPAGVASSTTAVMNGSINWGQSEYGGYWHRVAFHEIGHALGLGHSYDIPSVMGAQNPTVLPGDHDLVHLSVIFPAHGTDIDVYSFELDGNGTLAAETVVARPGEAVASLLDSVLTLYREDATGRRELVARNDDSFGRDSFVGLDLPAADGSDRKYTYYLAVTSTGNTAFDPEVEDSGANGRSNGDYRLRVSFTPAGEVSNTIVDETGTPLDGDRDGLAGGAFHFWFRSSTASNTVYVDKAAATAGADGSLDKPFTTVSAGLTAAAQTIGKSIVRIVGNAAGTPYLVGTNLLDQPLADGTSFVVPRGVTVMIDAGAVFKFRNQVIDVGSSSPTVSRAGAALQVLGTPGSLVQFTSYHDDSIGGNSDGVGPPVSGGQWGGIIFRQDSDSASRRVFLNSVSNATLRYGGGQVSIDGKLQAITSLHLESTRPTLAFNKVLDGAGAAISADPNSFEESNGRAGPSLRGNVVRGNSINGLLVRIRTLFGQPIDRLSVPARFSSPDITYVIPENLIIAGGVGGYQTYVQKAGNLTLNSPWITGLESVADLQVGMRVSGSGLPSSALIKSIDATNNRVELTAPAGQSSSGVTLSFEGTQALARASGRLTVDPGVVVKLQGSRIELERGNAQLYAEGTPQKRVIFTSTQDNRFGAGGTFVAVGSTKNAPAAGDWGGIVVNDAAAASLDNAAISFGGGQTGVGGGFAATNTLSVDQGTLRLANSRFENNANGIYVIGAQPVIVGNDFRGNAGDLISIDANSLNSRQVADPGRMTGASGRFEQYDDNRGPLVRGNTVTAGGVSGLVVRGDQITVESVWDDTDIVHVLRDEIVVSNLHTATRLQLMSSPKASLVVKLRGSAAGFTATGYGLDIDDRIGGTVQVIGQPGYPVILTSLADDSIGASVDPIGATVTDTNGDGTASRPRAGEWRGLRFLPYSNDRNVAVVRETEPVATGGVDVNAEPGAAQFLGVLAPNEVGGDDNRRLGFEVYGAISLDAPSDLDVYSFSGYAGSEVWIDIDNTSPALDAMVELLDSSGNVIARSADAQTDHGPLPGVDGKWAGLSGPTLGSGLPLMASEALGYDLASSNPRDPGLRVVLPGIASVTPSQYYIRVRSQPKSAANVSRDGYEAGLVDPGRVATGATSGLYELRVRLRQIDEKPGSTVRYADIRYPAVGIDVQGLPQHSPLVGTTGESTKANDTIANAQYVGNLLASDLNTISIAGSLSGAADVDWYVLDLNYEQIQAIAGVNNGLKTWSTVFDIDYADGFRGDLTLSVFDSQGRLMYVGRDSNVADDQPGTGQTNFEDVSRGSAGKLDPFIGPVHLPTGLPGSSVGEGGVTPPNPDAPAPATTRYYVAVSSNERLPAVLDMTFNATATNAAVRLEPVNSITRVIEDRIGLQGYHSGELVSGTDDDDYTYVAPSNLFGLFPLSQLKNQVTAFTLNDVGYYLSGSGEATGTVAAVDDLAMRTDGRLYTYAGVGGAANTAGTLSWINIRTNATTTVGRDNIPDFPAAVLPTEVTDAAADLTTKAAVTLTTQFQLDAHPAAISKVNVATITGGALQYTGTLPGGLPGTGLWNFTSNATGVLTFSVPDGVTIPAGLPAPVSGAGNSFVNDAGVVTVTWSGPVTLATVPFATPGMTNVTYTYVPNPPPPNALTTDAVDALAWKGSSELYYSVRDVDIASRTPTGKSRLYRGNPGSGDASPVVNYIGVIDGFAGIGLTTGMAFIPTGPLSGLYGVDQLGHLFKIDPETALATRIGTGPVSGVPNTSLQGLAIGPQNATKLDGTSPGYFADRLFAISADGDLMCLDPATAKVEAVFPGNAKSQYLGTIDPVTLAETRKGGYTGFAFSPLDVPLWRGTNNRGSDAGHGVTISLDRTRDAGYDNETKTPVESKGNTSIYYGLDGSGGTAPDKSTLSHVHVVSKTWLADLTAGVGTSIADLPFKGSRPVTVSGKTWENSRTVSLASTRDLTAGMEVSGPGISAATTVRSIDSPTQITLSSPATASGDPVDLVFVKGVGIKTQPFSLEGRSYTDKPTLYFNYRIEAGAGSTRVQIRADGVRDGAWITIAANEHTRSKLDTADQTLPAFPSVSANIGKQPNQLVQELFERSGWRQARIDIGEYAGRDNVELRFVFTPGSGAEGLYLDDFIVGFAERGEMVTNAPANTSFFDIGTPTSPTTPQQNLQGAYQLEIRRGMEYGELTSRRAGAVQILGDTLQSEEPVNVVDSNDRLVRGQLHSGEGFGGVAQKQNLRGDENTPRGQGQFIIEGNVVSHADQYGIRIDAAARDAATGASPTGVVKNTPVLNTSRLVPGVVVANNVIASTHREAAILFSGDPIADQAAPVPYGRIVNNTIHGGVPVTLAATTTLNSAQVTLPATGELWSGMVVTGAGIPADTRILSIDSATGVTLTREATAAGSGVPLTFAFRTVGVQVTDNAAPTLLNNVFASLATGISVDGTSAAGTVVEFSAFYDTKAVGVPGNGAVTLTDSPFVNAARGNFYPVATAPIIDRALDVLQDRDAYVAVTQPLGIPVSPIIAPSRDLFGQLRSDDATQASPPGLGSNVFKDLGAIDRVDFVQPWLTLAEPFDQGLTDGDPTLNSVAVSGSAATGMAKFILQLNDAGVGVDKTTVVKQAFTIVRNGTTLTEGTDYVFRYLESTNRVVFESPSAFALGEYEIIVSDSLTDVAGNKRLNNNTNGTTTFRVLLIDLPGAPTAVSGTAGNTQVSLAWTAPAGSFGVSEYLIQYRENVPGSSWLPVPAISVAATTTTATVTGLTNGTAYLFRVAAVNPAGNGDYSAASAPVTPSTPAGEPTGLTPTFGDRFVKLDWTPPTSTGGTAISDYVVQFKQTTATTWDTFTDGTSTAATATVTNLTNGVAYDFRVAAVNASGAGAFSSTVSATPRAVPSAPTGLAGQAGNAQVVLTWTAAVANGAAVTGYRVEFKTLAASVWSTFYDGPSTATSATVTGLANGVAYLFRVSALNSVGYGSTTEAGPFTPAAPATAPGGLTATFGNASVKLDWALPTSDGGAPISDYVVQFKPTTATTWETFADGPATAATATVTGLTNGVAYDFRVAAVNAVGTGAYSAVVTETPRTVPGAVTNVQATGANGRINITWDAPASNGGAAISDYMISMSTSETSGFKVFNDGVSTATSAAVTGLTNGVQYFIRIRARNAVGNSPAAQVGPVVPFTVSAAPIGLTGSPGNGLVNLSWTAPTDNGGAAISGYVVQYRISGGAASWISAPGGSVAGTTAAVTGLVNGTPYLFRVWAVNAAGDGAAVESAALTPRTVPGAVTNVQATGANGRINITWDAPASNGGAAISDYMISMSTSETSGFKVFNDGVSTATSAAVTGLTNGVQYFIRIRARNAAGNSAIVQVGPVVPFVQAAAPVGLAGSVGSGSVNLSWTAPASPRPISDYVLQFRTDVAGSTWTTFTDGVSTATTGRVTGLVNGTRYLFRVAAVNADGVGIFTDGTLGLTPMAAPGSAPASVTGRGAAGRITLNWGAVPALAGAPVTGYVIQARVNSSTATWVTVPLSIGNVTTAEITTLTSRLGYTFRVAAVNAAGLGPWSPVSGLIRSF